MSDRSTTRPSRVWEDSSHASLCVLGPLLRHRGILPTLEQGVTIHQKVLKYTPAQKVTMVFIGILSGLRTISGLDLSLRADPALQQAFALPGCAEQSVIADTLDAATEDDVAALRQALEAILEQHSLALRHDFTQQLLVLDVDLSPAPCGGQAEGAEHGYMGRYRGKRGRKLVRVREAQSHETLYETVMPGNQVESLPVVRMVVECIEKLYGMAGEDEAAKQKRARTEWRMDSAWGSDPILTFLLGRGYQVTGKFRSHSRIKRLIRGIAVWQEAWYANTDWGDPPEPAVFARPLRQIATRTVCPSAASGYRYTVFFSSRQELSPREVLAHYDGRAGTEADIKGDKYGLGLAAIRKGSMAAQRIIVLLTQLAHNVLLWTRAWLAAQVPELRQFGVVRLVREVWAIPGRVKMKDGAIRRVRLRQEHRRARQVARALAALLLPGQTIGLLGQN
jgi:hypothetical protein